MTYDIILEILEEEHQLNADVEEQVEIQTNMKVISINHYNKLRKLNVWKRRKFQKT